MLKELKVQHREIARLRFNGVKPSEIASKLSMNIQSVYNILRDPLCKSFLAGLSDKADESTINVRRTLAEMNPLALNALKGLLDPTSTKVPASVVLGASKDVLDRNGYGAPEKHEHVHNHFTTKDLDELRQRAKDATEDN